MSNKELEAIHQGRQLRLLEEGIELLHHQLRPSH